MTSPLTIVTPAQTARQAELDQLPANYSPILFAHDCGDHDRHPQKDACAACGHRCSIASCGSPGLGSFCKS